MSDDTHGAAPKRVKLPDSVIEVFKDVAREHGIDFDPDAPPSEAVEHWLKHGSPIKKVIPPRPGRRSWLDISQEVSD